MRGVYKRHKNKGVEAKQFLFAKEYAIDANGTRAAMAAGYTTDPAGAAVTASRLLGDIKIRQEIDRHIESQIETANVSKAIVVREIARVAMSDVTEMLDEDGSITNLKRLPKGQRIALNSVTVEERTERGRDGSAPTIVRTTKVRMHDKIKALDQLARMMGLYEADNRQQAAPQINLSLTI